MVGGIGFEPMMCPNLEPMPGYKPSVLPTKLTTQCLVHRDSFELPTRSV